jgi:hypothetical protein
MINESYIYALIDPVTGHVRYIGYTSFLKKRFEEHKRSKSGTYKGNWICSLRKNGMVPLLEIIDVVEECSVKFWEEYYISLYKSWGFKLTNGTLGGDGTKGYKYTEEQIKKVLDTKKMTGSALLAGRKAREANLRNGTYEMSRQRMKGDKNPGKKQMKPVNQYSLSGELIKTWNCAKHAAESLGICRSGVYRAAIGMYKSYGGYKWKRINDLILTN